MIKFQQASQLPMRKDFSRIPQADIQRSAFDRSHGILTTLDEGYLYPIYWDVAYPGDTHSVSMNMLIRLNTPVKPFYTPLKAETFFFAVPLRLIHTDAPIMLGEVKEPQADPYDPPPANTHVVPQIVTDGTNNASGSLSDYFGIPVNDGAGAPVVGLRHWAYYHRSYNRCWSEWFRDENMQQSPVLATDEADDVTVYTLKRRGKRHDYFTSVLPWPQKSAPVSMPLAGQAPVLFNNGAGAYSDPTIMMRNAQGSQGNSLIGQLITPNYDVRLGSAVMLFGENIQFYSGRSPDAVADLGALTAFSMTQFFQAYAVQQLYQTDGRHGTRYPELIKGHFGVTSPDARLQRTEYIGGGCTDINITPLPQTSATGATGTPLGNLAAMGVGLGGRHGFTYSATEHCVLIGLVCIRADLLYQQGLEREMSARSRFDFYWPSLSNIGEQAVLSKEIYCDAAGSGDDDVFGYQEAWAHLRYKMSRVTGLMRSNVTGSLDLWHLGQDFGSRPSLGSQFIEENPPVARVVAVPSEPHFQLDGWLQVKSVRPMPVFSVPGIHNRL